MQHAALPVLIQDLSIILIAAGSVSLLFRWLKHPVILGYVVAGILVGPHFPWLQTVKDVENIRIWGEIGVIFVLFSLGLEFSFRRLSHVGGTAGITAVIETSLILALGAFLGLLLGWSHMDAMFLGGILCISSTTVIVKVFEELGLKQKKFAQLVFGVLIVEDLVAVLLLVLLSTLAMAQQSVGWELASATVRLGFFLTLWFVVGLMVLPWLVRRVRGLFGEEGILIFAMALCFLMVLLATQAGFSPALGAFVMGSLFAETSERRRIEHLMQPLRNFFAAIFFVSVGMLFDPHAMLEWWPLILLLSAFVIFVKIFAVTGGALMAGQTLRTSLRASLSLTQIGEFSFIMASLGVSLGVVGPQLYPIAVGVSLVTAFFTPYWIRHADRIYEKVEFHLPARIRRGIESYHNFMEPSQSGRSLARLMVSFGPPMIVNLVLIVATVSILRGPIYERVEATFGNALWVRVCGLAVTLLLCSPFFWGLCFRRASPAWREHVVANPRARWLELAITVFRLSLGGLLVLVVLGLYVSARTLSGFTMAILLVSGWLLYQFGGRWYRRLESQLLGQLQGGAGGGMVTPWEAQISELSVGLASSLCGRSLEAVGQTINGTLIIAAIDRGSRRILAPKAQELILPGDHLFVLGDEASVDDLRKITEVPDLPPEEERPLRLFPWVLPPGSSLVGRTLRDSRIRELVDGLVVGIERGSFRRLSPPPDQRLEVGDCLWIVGDPERLRELENGP